MRKKVWPCSICVSTITGRINYAIRDVVPNETSSQWFWRHVIGFFTIGIKRKKHAFILPVCDSCVRERLHNNMMPPPKGAV